mgnify:CR=1 FL=1
MYRGVLYDTPEVRSLADIVKIAELEEIIRGRDELINNAVSSRNAELEKERDVRDLEQQAKGVQNLTKNNAETVKNYPWFVDAPPTLEYLYDVGFGMDSKTAIYYAEGLLQQAKALKEQG